ncbi:uncharacterized protein LOC119643792 isoform X2 [Glossina fuscipes]|uniref:Uncharacterized protein LOC119643792 isoform X2 n=1 Tax=Glossina fuscipes TaxID=7396 RepID=A0A9C6E0P9_9MUSC|nr:uncharacterized protein LOC119643792 isoform X2 [Glossina fuscipes]
MLEIQTPKNVNFFKIYFCLVTLFLDTINISSGSVIRMIPAVGNVQRDGDFRYYSIGTPFPTSYIPTKLQSNEDINSYPNPLQSITPSCEKLKAMWNLSRRRVRASEITNEIPTFHDPFAYNSKPHKFHYASPHTIESDKIFQSVGIPMFGRVAGREPIFSSHVDYYDRPRVMVRSSPTTPIDINNADTKSQNIVRRPTQQFRHGGGGVTGIETIRSLNASTSKDLASFVGSFQKLKQLIWAERAKESTQRRRVKEIYARANELRDIAKGRKFQIDEATSKLSKRMRKSLKLNEPTAALKLINWIEYPNNLLQVDHVNTNSFSDSQETKLSSCTKWHHLQNLELYLKSFLTYKLAKDLLEKFK